jgi:signal transduction histidine kinase
MKKVFSVLIAVMFALFCGASFAGDRGAADEAVAMVRKAVAYIKAHGKEKAFAEFQNPGGQFRDRDLYIFVVDFEGKTLAHGANPKLVGKDVIQLRDADGKYFIKNYLELAQSKGKGWIDYKWVSPVTSTIEQKSSYGEKVDDFVVGCGIYK